MPNSRYASALESISWKKRIAASLINGFEAALTKSAPVFVASSRDKSEWRCISSPGSFWIKLSSSPESHKNAAIGKKLPTKANHKNMAVTSLKMTQICLGQCLEQKWPQNFLVCHYLDTSFKTVSALQTNLLAWPQNAPNVAQKSAENVALLLAYHWHVKTIRIS